MSKLILMNYLSGMIDTKIEKISDFIYPNMFNNSKESKQMVSFYLKDVLGTENQLVNTYEDFIKLFHRYISLILKIYIKLNSARADL